MRALSRDFPYSLPATGAIALSHDSTPEGAVCQHSLFLNRVVGPRLRQPKLSDRWLCGFFVSIGADPRRQWLPLGT